MLLFGNTKCAAQIAARPKSSFLFHEKLSTYVSPKVSGFAFTPIAIKDVMLILKKVLFFGPVYLKVQLISLEMFK